MSDCTTDYDKGWMIEEIDFRRETANHFNGCHQREAHALALNRRPTPNARRSEATIRMEQDLGVSIHSPVKLVVRFDGFVDTDLMADDEAWLGSSGDDEVAKVAIVRLDIALARTQR